MLFEAFRWKDKNIIKPFRVNIKNEFGVKMLLKKISSF